jgi:hypothetical protein
MAPVLKKWAGWALLMAALAHGDDFQVKEAATSALDLQVIQASLRSQLDSGASTAAPTVVPVVPIAASTVPTVHVQTQQQDSPAPSIVPIQATTSRAAAPTQTQDPTPTVTAKASASTASQPSSSPTIPALAESNAASASGPNSGSKHNISIALGTVCGIIGVGIIGAAIWLYLRRRRGGASSIRLSLGRKESASPIGDEEIATWRGGSPKDAQDNAARASPERDPRSRQSPPRPTLNTAVSHTTGSPAGEKRGGLGIEYASSPAVTTPVKAVVARKPLASLRSSPVDGSNNPMASSAHSPVPRYSTRPQTRRRMTNASEVSAVSALGE